MQLLKRSWIFSLLLVLVLNSCGSSRVAVNRSIQKRKYNKGWYFKKHNKAYSSVRTKQKLSSPQNKVQISSNKVSLDQTETNIAPHIQETFSLESSHTNDISSIELDDAIVQLYEENRNDHLNIEEQIIQLMTNNRDESNIENDRGISIEEFAEKRKTGKSDKRFRRFIFFLVLSTFFIIMLAALNLANPEFLAILLVFSLVLMIVNGIALLHNRRKARKNA